MFDRPIPPTRLKIAQFLLGIGLLGIVTELVTGQHWILPGSVMAAVGGALLGLTRWVCPRCGLKQTSICTAQQLCSVCGVPGAKESAPPD